MSGDKAYDALLDAAQEFLARRDVRPAVIGGYDIRHQPGERKFNHELVIKFTAKLPGQEES